DGMVSSAACAAPATRVTLAIMPMSRVFNFIGFPPEKTMCGRRGCAGARACLQPSLKAPACRLCCKFESALDRKGTRACESCQASELPAFNELLGLEQNNYADHIFN